MREFKIPPISTLAGSTIRNYFKVIRHQKIEPQFFIKIILTTLIILIATPFHWWEQLVFHRKLSKLSMPKAPLFIIGHWRSGTTLLHNVLCKDPEASYMTTYQSLFPNNLASKWIFKTFMKLNMPNKRPSDNVELNINFPQEDEFALSNCQANAYYNFFYFPREYKSYYKKAIKHEGLNNRNKRKWFSAYDRLIKKALINTKGKRVIFKNPVNTARIDKLLKLYPDAKFLYIYRNPITVFYSTQKFFQKLFPTLWMHKVDKPFIDQLIFDIYKSLLSDYEAQKALIPAENLMELKFEEFEDRPASEMKKIYAQLLNEDYAKVENYFNEYLDSLKGYQKNSYELDQEVIDKVYTHWGQYMEKYNYSVPDNVVVKRNKKTEGSKVN